MAEPPAKLAKQGDSSPIATRKVVLVTGGNGLVGHGIQSVLAEEGHANEKWVFLSSTDGDLR